MGEMKPYPKYFEKIRIRPDKDAELKSRAPSCQWDGCDEPGTHRAPVGRMKGQSEASSPDRSRSHPASAADGP